MRSSGSWLAVATVVVAALAGCGSTSHDGTLTDEVRTPSRVVWANPNWADRKGWYATSQGSFLVEDAIFLALERADSEAPFASPATLEPLGFLYPPAGTTDLTSDPRLPLGVVRDRKPGAAHASVGFTCAACHTGVLDTPDGSTRILIDGGQSFIDFAGFLRALHAALDVASSNAEKKARLCVAIGSPADCSDRLVNARDHVAGMLARSRDSEAPEGPGRVDALTREANEIFSHQLANEPTYTLDAPISLPQVWDAPRLSCLQTNCLPLDPLARNVSEQIVVFGETKVHRDGSWIVAEGTTELENLYTLEHSLVSLASPKWRDLPLPPLDDARVARGGALFRQACASCHTEPYRTDAPDDAFVTEEVAGHSTKVWKATASTPDEVGTDRAFVDAHTSRFVSDPLLIDIFDQKLWNAAAAQLGVDPRNPLSAVAIAPAVAFAKAALATQGFYDLWGNPLELATYGGLTSIVVDDSLARAEPDAAKRDELRNRYQFYRAPKGSATKLAQYKARPLNGIAFTAPFGHGGAWPTLRDVLEVPDARPRSFVIRPGSFDPVRVGLDQRPARAGETLFVHDGTKKGNTPSGHPYGTDLAPADKDALLEYLKSI